jgi:hypothetical protein
VPATPNCNERGPYLRSVQLKAAIFACKILFSNDFLSCAALGQEIQAESGRTGNSRPAAVLLCAA